MSSWAEEAFAGEPRCVLLRGEAGIGKSRWANVMSYLGPGSTWRPTLEVYPGRD